MHNTKRLLLQPGVQKNFFATQFLPSESSTSRSVKSFFRFSSTDSLRMADTTSAEQLGYESVHHDVHKQEFFISIPHGDGIERAFIQYSMSGNSMNLYHTLVPPVFRGKGVAKLLTKKALDHAIEKDLQLIPTCSYVAKYIKDNPLPEYTSRI